MKVPAGPRYPIFNAVDTSCGSDKGVDAVACQFGERATIAPDYLNTDMRIHNLLGTAALTAVGACSILESDGGPRVSVSAVMAPVDVSLGDTVHISIAVRNIGDREVSIGTTGCNTEFLISDSNGNAYVPAELVYCTLELRAPTKLAPGATHEIRVFSTGRAIPQGTQQEPAMLPPGDYRLRPVVSVMSGNESAVVVSSDPVYVTFR